MLYVLKVPAHSTDLFATYVSSFIGFLFCLTFVWPVTRLVKVFVEEKETRIREGMTMMGLRPSALWLSWLITYALIFTVMSLTIVVITSNSVYKVTTFYELPISFTRVWNHHVIILVYTVNTLDTTCVFFISSITYNIYL